MPEIGEIKPARELGYKYWQKYIWHACEKCGKERWVQLWSGHPHFVLCGSCALKGKPKHFKPRIISEEQRHPKLKTCTTCGITYPATRQYFHIDSHVYCGLVARCRDCSNKRIREYQREYTLRTGKVKRTREQYLHESAINREVRERKFAELRQNKGNIRGTIGEIRRAREVGIDSSDKVQWVACEKCGKERWVRLLRGKPQSLHCGDCSKGIPRIPKRTLKILETGLKECTECHQLLPANTEHFTASHTKLGIGAICITCAHQKSADKRHSEGKRKVSCRICGKKYEVWNTSKLKGVCGGCSQKLSGKQKLPRGPHRYNPKPTSVCHKCGTEYPATAQYFKRSKVTKSGLDLGTCKRCYNKARRARELATTEGRLSHRISFYISQSLNGTKQGRSWQTLVGYTVEQLKRHLEKRFDNGMSWDNYGDWHIDHVIPKAAFHYENAEDVDFKRCWALKNLQPLWAKDNIVKRDKILKPFQPSLKF